MNLKTIQEKTPPFLHTPLNIAFTLSEDMVRFDLFKHASAMAYVTLLSLIPSLAAIFSLISLFSPLAGSDSIVLQKAKAFILSHLAAGSGEQVVVQIESFLSNLDTTKIGITGLVGLMFSLILLLRQIELALNKIWLVSRERNLITRFVYFWTFLTLGTFLLAVIFGSLAGSQISSLLQLGVLVPIQRSLISYLAPWAAGLVFFIVLYKVVPNCYVSWKQALTGAIPALIFFRLASSSYGSFTAKFTNYQAIYGALAAVPLFLMWLYILWLIILFGALLSWRSQQGFFIAQDKEDESHAKSPGEKRRNYILQTELPFLILDTVFENFESKEPRNLTGLDIAHKLCLPVSWVRESIELLVQKDWVAITLNDNKLEFAGSGDLASYPLLPKHPRDKIKNEDLKNKLNYDATEWLKKWPEYNQKQFEKYFKNI